MKFTLVDDYTYIDRAKHLTYSNNGLNISVIFRLNECYTNKTFQIVVIGGFKYSMTVK